MNMRGREVSSRGYDQTGVRPKHLLFVVAAAAVILTLPATVGAEAARQGGDGYGTAWYVDPGEWYVAPAAPVAQARQAQSFEDGYGIAWFTDPGEWYAAPVAPVAQASEDQFEDDGHGTAWFVDPGEWYLAQEATGTLTSQDPSAIEAHSTWFVDPGETCSQC